MRARKFTEKLGNSLNWFSELLAFSRNLANHYPTTHILAKQKTSCCKLDFDFYLWEAIFSGRLILGVLIKLSLSFYFLFVLFWNYFFNFMYNFHWHSKYVYFVRVCCVLSVSLSLVLFSFFLSLARLRPASRRDWKWLFASHSSALAARKRRALNWLGGRTAERGTWAELLPPDDPWPEGWSNLSIPTQLFPEKRKFATSIFF